MRISKSEFFRQATLRIFSSLNVQLAMARLMDYLKPHIPVSGMFFGLYDPELNVGKHLAGIWPDEIEHPGQTVSFPTEYWDFMKKHWQEEKGVLRINDIAAESAEKRKIFRTIWPENYSHISLSLMLGRKRLGTFGIFAPQKHQYTEQHIELIELLNEPLAMALNKILQHQEIRRLTSLLADDNRYLKRQMLEMTGETIIGANFGLKNVLQMIRQVAPTNSPVILMGETGVGKEVIANAIYSYSSRKEKPFIKVNCGAIPENLVDSELFGHEKGAFTGALARKRGRFERAHTGTIFLDEIGELPLAAQLRLLRVLQQHEIERVGGTEVIPVDVRIISATHRNLEEMVRKGTFREDLWFRLNVFPVIIPPLRQRQVDIPALVNHFMERKSKELKIRELPPLAPGTMEALQRYHWPGNVRELENVVERALILNQIGSKSAHLRFDLFPKTKAVADGPHLKGEMDDIPPLETIIVRHIQKALSKAGGKVEGDDGAARLLGLHPSTLRGKMRKMGIPFGKHVK